MNPDRDSHHRQAERRAAEWLARRDRADWSGEDQQALDRWLEESSAHAVAFIRLEAAWHRANRLKALGAGLPPRQVPAPAALKTSPFFDASAPAESLLRELIHEPARPRRPGWLRWAVAASLAVIIAAALVWTLPLSQDLHRTPVGGMAAIPLQDGSRVTLNTDSQVRVRVTAAERHVELERGEAYFEVARDAHRPFVVSAGGQRIVAVGTAFSVRREDGEVRVLVTEGRVRVQTREVDAGGVVRADGDGVVVEKKSLADVQEAVSWRSGMIVLRDVDLAAAVAEFNRYNERRIRIEDPEIAAIRLSGKFRSSNVESFVRLLEEGFPIQAQDRGDGVVLRRR